jgi:outer membrane lipoprotein-sorting protein
MSSSIYLLRALRAIAVRDLTAKARRARRLQIAFFVGMFSAFTGAQTTSPDSPSTQPAGPVRASMKIIEGVQQHLKGINSVESDFVENKKLAMLDHTLTIDGHMALEKPDRLIWIVRDPVKYAVRIVGDEVSQWDEDTNHVDVMHLGGDPTFKAITQQMQAWFLGNYKALGDSYDVYVNREQPLSLEFVPNSSTMVAKLIARIDLTFSPDEDYIDTMVITETGGDVTTLKFTGARINQPISDQIWEMPPHER